MTEDYRIGYILGVATMMILGCFFVVMGAKINTWHFLGLGALSLAVMGISWFVHRNDKEIEDE